MLNNFTILSNSFGPKPSINLICESPLIWTSLPTFLYSIIPVPKLDVISFSFLTFVVLTNVVNKTVATIKHIAPTLATMLPILEIM